MQRVFLSLESRAKTITSFVHHGVIAPKGFSFKHLSKQSLLRNYNNSLPLSFHSHFKTNSLLYGAQVSPKDTKKDVLHTAEPIVAKYSVTLSPGLSATDWESSKVEKLNEVKTKLTRLPKIYGSLSKWYLTLFVVMTADAGFCLAPMAFDHYIFFFATLGTALCSCAANTLNQIAEVPYDAQMVRTMKRPLVCNSITPLHATGFAIAAGVSGVALLYAGTNLLTAGLGLSTIFLYAGIYTPLKRTHWFNTWVGAVVGAIPPVMGWTAATGSLSSGALIFSGILYAWQFPHFFALAWRRRGDYARGSYHMLPLSHPDATKTVVLLHSLGLCALCAAAPFTGVTSWGFVGLSLPLNLWLSYQSFSFYRKGNSKSAQSLYKCSLYYILLISLAITFDRKVLNKVDIQKQKDELKLTMVQHKDSLI